MATSPDLSFRPVNFSAFHVRKNERKRDSLYTYISLGALVLSTALFLSTTCRLGSVVHADDQTVSNTAMVAISYSTRKENTTSNHEAVGRIESVESRLARKLSDLEMSYVKKLKTVDVDAMQRLDKVGDKLRSIYLRRNKQIAKLVDEEESDEVKLFAREKEDKILKSLHDVKHSFQEKENSLKLKLQDVESTLSKSDREEHSISVKFSNVRHSLLPEAKRTSPAAHTGAKRTKNLKPRVVALPVTALEHKQGTEMLKYHSVHAHIALDTTKKEKQHPAQPENKLRQTKASHKPIAPPQSLSSKKPDCTVNDCSVSHEDKEFGVGKKLSEMFDQLHEQSSAKKQRAIAMMKRLEAKIKNDYSKVTAFASHQEHALG